MAMADPLTANPPARITRLDRWTGPVMFWVSLAFLTIVAGMLCSFSIEVAALARFVPAAAAIDRVTSHEPSPVEAEQASFGPPGAEDDLVPVDDVFRPLRRFAGWLGLLYVAILGEGLAQALQRGNGWRRHLWYCLVPPLRIGGRDHVDGSSLWLPHLGWSRVDRNLQQRLEKAFNLPMLLIALAVLPLVALDYHWQHQAASPRWYVLIFLWASESLIWLAFAFEFVVMFSIAPKKLRYCRDHWVDLVIIVAPMAAFLRLLRMTRVLRLSKVAPAARAYRLRGLSQRMFRGLLLLTLVRQVLEGSPAKRLVKLRDELRDREHDLEQLRAEIASLEARLADETEADSSTNGERANGERSCNSGDKSPT
jgi:voltage-gated potassium channel